MKGIGRDTGKGRCRSCLGEEHVRTHIAGWFRNCNLQNEMFKWEMVDTNTEMAYSDILRCADTDRIKLDRYVDNLRNRWFNLLKPSGFFPFHQV